MKDDSAQATASFGSGGAATGGANSDPIDNTPT